MAKNVRRNRLTLKRWPLASCDAGVLGQEQRDGVPAERLSAARREQQVGGLAVSFPHPFADDRDDLRRQRGAPGFPSLALAANMGPTGELNVLAAKPSEFGDPQPGLE